MKERPILFSAPMVRAILSCQKTQTRRVVKPQPEWTDPSTAWLNGDGHSGPGWYAHNEDYPEEGSLFYRCPYGQPGDRLWVKETWQYYDWDEEGEPCIRYAADNATAWPNPSQDDWAEKLVDVWESLSRDENFKIDCRARDRKWRPSIFMPRWASRIQLEVVSVRVERLNDISEADCWAEGIEEVMHLFDGPSQAEMAKRLGLCLEDAKPLYAQLWESINGAGSWDANSWVWVVEFKQMGRSA